MVAEEKYVITMKENESNESEKMDQNKKKLKIIAHATPLDVLFAFANLYSSPFQSIELAGTFFPLFTIGIVHFQITISAASAIGMSKYCKWFQDSAMKTKLCAKRKAKAKKKYELWQFFTVILKWLLEW